MRRASRVGMPNSDWRVPGRYLLNGVAATAIHFLVLSVNVEMLHFRSTGVANLVAALFGSASAFVGNRYFVFRKREDAMHRQAVKFAILYLSMAGLHGAVLFAWSDLYGWDYRIGFVVATSMQVVAGFFGNKHLVFGK